jgi:hypothetical protein
LPSLWTVPLRTRPTTLAPMSLTHSQAALAEPTEGGGLATNRAEASEQEFGGLRRQGLLIGSLGILAGVIAVRIPREIGQDTWLSLLVGRRVAHAGIPHHDVFTAWTLGQAWVDQQWLAHLLLYGVYAAGGMVLLSAMQVVLLVGAIAGAVTFARRRGAAARTIAWLLVASIYPILLAAGAVRTQTLVLPLFVATLALLTLDARRPANTVLLALPMLVLWSNLHGSVVVGVALVALRGLLGFAQRANMARYLTLTVGAVLSIGATPYGTDVLTYYRATLESPAFRRIVTEWGAPTPSLMNAPIFALIGIAVWLLARRTKEVGRFGLFAELFLIILALTALRSAVWLGLGSIVLLAPALDAELGGKELAVERMNRMVGMFGVAFAAIMLVTTLSQGTGGLTNASFPSAAADAVARAAAARPRTTVYSNERYADWLLFSHPELTGRVAFDARFEMLSAAQLQRIFVWTNQITDDWRRTIDGSGVVVLDLPDEEPLQVSLRDSGGLHEVFSNKEIAVFATQRP